MKGKFRVSGKAILTGEHSVLRGVPAIVVPVHEKFLELLHDDDGDTLRVSSMDSLDKEAELVLWGVLERALSLCGKDRSDITGQITMRNALSVGVGLGASAALCVAVGRFIQSFGWVKESNLFEFCRELENLFHGESSGVDIAVVLRNEPILYQREVGAKSIDLKWYPNLSISYCGQRGVTSECVAQVKKLIADDPQIGQELDRKMGRATELALRALSSSEKEGIFDLVEAFQKARECFDRWDLTRGKLEDHIEEVLKKGALAVKPTGSGGGGHALSLWRVLPSGPDFTSVFPR